MNITTTNRSQWRHTTSFNFFSGRMRWSPAFRRNEVREQRPSADRLKPELQPKEVNGVGWLVQQCLLLLLAACTSCGSSSAAAQPPTPKPALGINLSGPADWNTELPFVDVFHLSREWISQKRGEGWGKGPSLELDEQGWIKKLEPNCFAETPLCTIEGGHYPSGEWTILWEGEGKLELSKGKVLKPDKQSMKVNIDANGGGFFLRILETNPKNPIKNIRVLMPGVTEKQAAENPWSKSFLDRWRGVACLRFMDFQETNNSKQKAWTDRPQPSDATYTRRGIPIELLCDLANRLEADAWFCIPHEANDDYIRQFAKLVKEKLAHKRKAYIEYSNEVWNGQFEQHRYAAEQGKKLGFAEKEWEAAWRFTAHRSVEIFKIWETEFGGKDRLVRVLPSQAANSYVSEQVLSWKSASKQADVLAIAPYISMNIPPGMRSNPPLFAEKVTQWTVDQFLDHVEQNALPQCIEWMKANKKVADEHQLKLVCYEAGQHFVGIGGAENNEALTKLLHAANAHPRMKTIYAKYLAAWKKSGGDLLCHFSSVGAWSKWGSWGVLQYADDDLAHSPKYQALNQWRQSLPK